MCRSIKQLRYPDRPPTDAELEAAAPTVAPELTDAQCGQLRKVFMRAIEFWLPTIGLSMPNSVAWLLMRSVAERWR